MANKDCEVCKKLMKEKHRNVVWWKVLCLIFAASTIILAILYFGSGAVITEEKVEINRSKIENEGDNGVIVINGNNVSDSYTGKVEKTDYTPIICITVIASVALIIAGGVLIANHAKKDL